MKTQPEWNPINMTYFHPEDKTNYTTYIVRGGFPSNSFVRDFARELCDIVCIAEIHRHTALFS